jgi:adenylate cyclase
VERALALCPNSAQVVTGAASYFSFACEPARAIPLFRTAIRLSPLDPQLGWMIGGQSLAELLAGDFTTALGSALRSLGLAPRWVLAHRVRIAALWQLGRQDEACDAAATLLALAPGTRADFGATYRVQTCVAALQATWRAAGLPG